MHGLISQNISIYILKLYLFCLGGGTGTCIMSCVREADNLLASPLPHPSLLCGFELRSPGLVASSTPTETFL